MSLKFATHIGNIVRFFILLPYLSAYLVYYYIKAFFKLFHKPKKSLEGETILITGCGTGIGKMLCLKLSEKYKDKITLVLWDINTMEMQNTVDLLIEQGTAKVFSYCVDISKPEQVFSTAKMVNYDVGEVTMLINNAGVSYNKDFLKLSPEEIDRTLRINFSAHFNTIKEFLPTMIQNNRGHIVATASMGGHIGLRGNVPYYTSKFALRGAMTALKEEIQFGNPDKTGLHFTTIYPWFVKTPLINQLDVRFRFPKLTPLLEPVDVASKIVDGIESNTEHLFVPSSYKLFFWLLRVVPETVRTKILDFAVLEYRGISDGDDIIIN